MDFADFQYYFIIIVGILIEVTIMLSNGIVLIKLFMHSYSSSHIKAQFFSDKKTVTDNSAAPALTKPSLATNSFLISLTISSKVLIPINFVWHKFTRSGNSSHLIG